MSSDVILIEPWDKNAKIPSSLQIIYDFLSKIVPIVSQKKLEECDLNEKELFKYQSGVIAGYPRYVARNGLLSIASFLLSNGYSVRYILLNYYIKV